MSRVQTSNRASRCLQRVIPLRSRESVCCLWLLFISVGSGPRATQAGKWMHVHARRAGGRGVVCAETISRVAGTRWSAHMNLTKKIPPSCACATPHRERARARRKGTCPTAVSCTRELLATFRRVDRSKTRASRARPFAHSEMAKNQGKPNASCLPRSEGPHALTLWSGTNCVCCFVRHSQFCW